MGGSSGNGTFFGVTYCPEKTNPRCYAVLSWWRERSNGGRDLITREVYHMDQIRQPHRAANKRGGRW